MEEPFACRVCLDTEVNLYYMHDNALKTAYENLTGVDMNHDGLPQYLCAYCSALVTKCVAFKKRCLRSQELLKYAIMEEQLLTADYIRTLNRVSHQVILPYTIVTTHRETLDTDYGEEESTFIDSDCIKSEEVSDEEPLSMKVKKKKKLKKNTDIKEEIDEIDFIDNPIDTIDTFDDITVGANVICGNSKISKIEFKDIDMVVLTKQQQLEEVLARKDSYNYQNSFYKCDKCFKGFVTDATYKNHMLRHDSSSGTEVCDVCQTRWPDARSLKAHAATSHERRYTCRLCDHTCKSSHKAKEHLKWHGGHKFVCKVCGSCFSKSTSYLTHLRLRHPSEHSCGECGERFISRNGLSMHAKKAHSDQKSSMTAQYKCALCQFSFRSFDALNKHTTYSDNGICDSHLSPCNQCGENFTSAEVLKEHQKIQHSAVEVRCEECDRTFAHERSLSVHFHRVHLGMKAKYKTTDRSHQTAVVCEICGKKCISNATLVNHQRTHTGEKPFQCAECPKSFSVFQRLKIHIRTHTGERPFKCLHCPKAFKHKAALNRHDRSNATLVNHQRTHTGEKPFQCAECPKSFSVFQRLKIHIRTHTGERPFKCLHCPKAFKHKAALNRHDRSNATLVNHQRTHTGEKPFQCAECPKSFSVFQRLKIHIRTHTGERPFKCLHCPKAFKHKAALNRHDRVHSGLKPYACTHCGKAFSQSNSMKLHVRTVHLKIPAPYKSRRNKNND